MNRTLRVDARITRLVLVANDGILGFAISLGGYDISELNIIVAGPLSADCHKVGCIGIQSVQISVTLMKVIVVAGTNSIVVNAHSTASSIALAGVVRDCIGW